MNVIPTKWAGLPFLRQRTATEWSSACPECGDSGHIGNDEPDRFRIFVDRKIRGWCRNCGFQAFGDDGKRWSPLEIEEMRRERVARAALERARVRDMIEQMTEEAAWKAYHEGMTDRERQLWRDKGVADSLQDWWELGHNPSYRFRLGDDVFESPTMTIPFWREDQVVNLQQRLLQPARPNDKYRFAYDMPSAVFFPERTPPEGRCIIFEGAIKTMVAWQHLAGKHLDLFDSCAGVPSKYINMHHVDELSTADSYLLCLDPDANEDGSTRKAAEQLGKDRVKIVTLPYKVDDLFVELGATPQQVAGFVKDAMPLR